MVRSVIAFIVCSCIGVFWIISSQNKLLQEYPALEVESEVAGRIAFKEIYKSIVRIKLEDQKQLTLPQAWNHSYAISELNNFIQLGDVIQKRRGTDTLIIFRENQQYIFRLRKTLGIPSSGYSTNMIPQPQFDQDIETLINEFKNKYHAKTVRIGRPFEHSSSSGSTYWLKVSFLDPELHDRTFENFAEEVAINTFNHLINDKDFEKIEVSITQKKGFIITFSSSRNSFYYRDSLRILN